MGYLGRTCIHRCIASLMKLELESLESGYICSEREAERFGPGSGYASRDGLRAVIVIKRVCVRKE